MVKLSFSLGGGKAPLSLGSLPPELLARLRTGEDLTPQDWALLRTAAASEGSIEAKLFEALLASGLFKDETGEAGTTTTEVTEDGTAVITGPTRTLSWTYEPGSETDPAPAPRTYYEALSGRRDQAAEYFVKARRAMHLVLTVLAIALPVGLTLLTIALGESLETIVFVAIGASIVALMLKSTFPRTPFD